MALLQAILDGLMLGGVYAVISIGLTLVFGVVSIVNFAQAQFLMVGMYVAYFAWRHLSLDPLLGSLLAFAVVFAHRWWRAWSSGGYWPRPGGDARFAPRHKIRWRPS